MLYRNPIIILFPILLITWFLVIRSWPPGSFQATPLYPEPAASTPATLVATTSVGISHAAEAETKNPIEEPIQDYAYVFYATSDPYACSALVNYRKLRTELNSKVPVILLASSHISNATIQVIQNAGIEVIRDEPPPIAPGGVEYYEDVLLKLRALRLQKIKPRLKRILILDADQLILKNLDSLFSLPSAQIAAPLAYWQDSTAVTTTLMVAELSLELWEMVDAAIKTIGRDEYDMDLVNRVFRKRLMVLPGRYCTLNSHWESLDLPGWFGDVAATRPAQTPEFLEELYQEVEILHFTAMGKPWSVELGDIKLLKPDAHPLFKSQFQQWKSVAKEACIWNPLYGKYN